LQKMTTTAGRMKLNTSVFHSLYRVRWYCMCKNQGFGLVSRSGSAWICIVYGSWIRTGSALKSKLRSFRGQKWSPGGPWMRTMEVWRLKMEPLMFCRLVVADSHHFDEEQDPDPDQH
jgi:hypothetical protein